MALLKVLLVASLAAVHSFASELTTITAAPPTPTLPTPTLDRRQGSIAGGPGTPILSTLTYAYTDVPEQVYPFAVLRGPQSGYNICNSTTEGPDSQCQTLIFNNVSDFCLWSSPDPNETIGDVEARVVAWCTQPGHGTRVIPQGAIYGVQFMRTSAYIQVSGFINDALVGLNPGASGGDGGELDPHGADLQGNPLGGIVFSDNTPDAQANGGQLTQVKNWNTFIGDGTFCFKACFNTVTSPDYCENRYDLYGCDYNMPSAVQNGTFTDCQGDLQDPMGIYEVDGTTSSFPVPSAFTQLPWTPRVPASSSCTPYTSAQLFAAAPSAPASSGSNSTSTTSNASSPTGTSGSKSGSSGSNGASTSNTGSSSAPSKTGSGNAAASIQVPFTALGAMIGFVTLGGFLVL